MITSIPPFINGSDYVDYPGDDGNWRFLNCRPLAIRINRPDLVERISFRHRGVEYARLIGCMLVVEAHYAWDGCSPKWRVGKCYFGTPDFEPTRLPSLIHDVFYQFSQTEHMPFNRFDVDAMFYDAMKLGGFKLAGTYHGAVRKFSGPAWKYMDPDCESVLIPKLQLVT